MPISLQNIYIDPDLLLEVKPNASDEELPFTLNKKVADYLEWIKERKSSLNFFIVCKRSQIDDTKPRTINVQDTTQNVSRTFTSEALFHLLTILNPKLFAKKDSFNFIPAEELRLIDDSDNSVLISNDPVLKDMALCDVIAPEKPLTPSATLPKPFEINESEFTQSKAKMYKAAKEKTPRRKLIYSFDIDDTVIIGDLSALRRIPVLNPHLIDKTAELIQDLIVNGIDVTDRNQVEFIVLSARLPDRFHLEEYTKVTTILSSFISAIKEKTGIEIFFSTIYCLKNHNIILFSEKGSDGTPTRFLERSLIFEAPQSFVFSSHTENMNTRAKHLHKTMGSPEAQSTDVTHIPLYHESNLNQNKALLMEYILLPSRTEKEEEVTIVHFDDDPYQLSALRELSEKLRAENSEHTLLIVSIHRNNPTQEIPHKAPKINRYMAIHYSKKSSTPSQPQPLQKPALQ